MIRMDRGTENTKIAALQYAFREFDDDEFAGEKSVCYGTSPANIVCILAIYTYFQEASPMQRIEGFWSILRKHKTGWWISALKVRF